MNIAVIAASGQSGKAFVEQALNAGHSVRAGVRRTNTLTSHPRLQIVTCDATNQTDVEALIKDQDAVVSCIGHVKNSPAQVQTEAMRTIVAVMQRQGMSRLVSLTGTGVRFPGDNINIMDRLLNSGILLVDPARIQDGKDHVALLQQTELAWTVIRVLKLQNTKLRPFHLTLHGPAKVIVSRQEVALAMLQVLEDETFIQQAPIVSN